MVPGAKVGCRDNLIDWRGENQTIERKIKWRSAGADSAEGQDNQREPCTSRHPVRRTHDECHQSTTVIPSSATMLRVL